MVGEYFWLAWIFSLLTVQHIFFNCDPLHEFFSICFLPYLSARGAFALGLYAVVFPRLVGRSRESVDVDTSAQVFEGFFATERLLWHSSPYRSRLGSRLSGIQTTWPAHFACVFCKRLCAQDAGPLQDLSSCLGFYPTTWCGDYCAGPENTHTPPTEGIWISWGWEVSKTKKFKEMCEALLEFPEGWGGLRKNPFRGGGMDIFWNYTIANSANSGQ